MSEKNQRNFFDQEKNQYAKELLLNPPLHTTEEIEKLLVLKGVTTCTLWNLTNKLHHHGFTNVQIVGLGIFPRSLFNFSKTLSRINDWLGNIPLLKLFAYRYLIVAQFPGSQKNIN